MKVYVRLYDAMRRGLISVEEYQKHLRDGRSLADRIEVEASSEF
ncbi:MAG: hypothetical protein N3G75_06345 [Methanothrix sp.]|nr:hypothetical protein [Methanothrix sp.]MCX8207435.1 hypothetical protein [Methanothrix sp.]